MRSRLWALLIVLSACTEPNPASCLDAFCSDPALPFCDATGSIGGVPNSCIAVSCTPNEFRECQADRALVCNEAGNNFDLVECPFGCGDTGCLPCTSTDCEQHIIPKYLGLVCDEVVSDSLSITEDLALDTDDNAQCTEVVPQPDAPEICVVHHGSITIATNKTLKAIGSRTLALVADRELVIDGVLDGSADGTINGPGGGFKKSGTGGNAAGGGAGLRSRGGSGGTATLAGGAMNGGSSEPNPITLAQLFGGTQPLAAAPGRPPGGAGGGITLISCRATVSVVGVVDVGGGGGSGGTTGLVQAGNPPPTSNQPGGGGTGGVLVIQGLDVMVSGQLFANGGGGGAGGTIVSQGGKGGDGGRSTTCAPGGSGQFGVGGFGGCVASDAGHGGASSDSLPGAGGGSAGFLLVYAPLGTAVVVDPVAVSPAFEPNGVVPTN